MAELIDSWNNPAFLRDVQYRTDANLAARQSIYAYQHPRIDLQGRVIDLAAPAPGETVADVGCGNGAYLGGGQARLRGRAPRSRPGSRSRTTCAPCRAPSTAPTPGVWWPPS